MRMASVAIARAGSPGPLLCQDEPLWLGPEEAWSSSERGQSNGGGPSRGSGQWLFKFKY